MSEGDSFTRSGVDGTRGLGVGGLIRCAGRPREWSCGAVPPQERWHEGGVVFVFSLEVAPVSEGDSFTRSGVDGTRVKAPSAGVRNHGTKFRIRTDSLLAIYEDTYDVDRT